jgi:hypothetical protein
MRSMLLAVLAMSFLFTTGCAVLGGRAAGSIYTDTKYGYEATGHKDTSKMGKACTQSILGLRSPQVTLRSALPNKPLGSPNFLTLMRLSSTFLESTVSTAPS